MIDYLDVTAGDANRSALLNKLINQNSANQVATGSFDSLNAKAAHAMGVAARPRLAGAMGSGPFPSNTLPSGSALPGLPVSGTAPYLNMPRLTAQVVGGVPAPQSPTGTSLNDLGRSYLQARQQQLSAQTATPTSVVTSG